MTVPKFGYSEEERNIFLRSNILKDKHPSLYQYMNSHARAKKTSVEVSTDSEVAVLLNRPNNYLTALFDQAQDEWTIVKRGILPEYREDTLRKTECELCGQKHLRHVYKMKNKLNENCMEIGSTCYEKYNFDKNNADPEHRKWFLENAAKRGNRTQREIEIDTKSDNALFLIKTIKREWDRLPFLPSAIITHKYLDLLHTHVDPFISRISNKSTEITPADIMNCRQYADKMSQILSDAQVDLQHESSVWRISRAVYAWAIEKDKKEKNPRISIATLLEKTCLICSSNVAAIMEESHRKECLSRISVELPQGSRIIVSQWQNDIIKYFYKIGDREYSFDIKYGKFIRCAAKLGFPTPGALRNISRDHLSSMDAQVDIQEGSEGNEFFRKVIQNMGCRKQKESSDGGTVLISYSLNGQIYGKTIDVSSLRPEITDAILHKRDEVLREKLRVKISGGKLIPLKDANSDWNYLHEK